MPTIIVVACIVPTIGSRTSGERCGEFGVGHGFAAVAGDLREEAEEAHGAADHPQRRDGPDAGPEGVAGARPT